MLYIALKILILPSDTLSHNLKIPYTHQVLAYHGALDIICHYPGAEQLFSTARWPGHSQFMESHRSGKISDEKFTFIKEENAEKFFEEKNQ